MVFLREKSTVNQHMPVMLEMNRKIVDYKQEC